MKCAVKMIAVMGSLSLSATDVPSLAEMQSKPEMQKMWVRILDAGVNEGTTRFTNMIDSAPTMRHSNFVARLRVGDDGLCVVIDIIYTAPTSPMERVEMASACIRCTGHLSLSVENGIAKQVGTISYRFRQYVFVTKQGGGEGIEELDGMDQKDVYKRETHMRQVSYRLWLSGDAGDRADNRQAPVTNDVPGRPIGK